MFYGKYKIKGNGYKKIPDVTNKLVKRIRTLKWFFAL